MQLKLEHGYFRLYLARLSKYITDKYSVCNIKENPEHLILYCKKYQKIREELKENFDIKKFSFKNLFNIKKEQEFLFKYIEKTQITTRN
jgi:hypothetical protein